MFYPGRIHTVSSESEGGKTWLALAAARHELDKGEAVVYLDFEDDEGGVVSRLLALGAQPADIGQRFFYLRPEEAITEAGGHEILARLMGDWRPTLAVLDGVTEAMSLHGLEMKDNTDVAKFGKLLPRFIANLGPAVVTLDHVVKSTENRGRYSIGGVHKLNGLNGAAYLLENRTPFGIGVTGKSTVRISKDRPGQLRRHALPSGGGLHWFGDLVIASHSDRVADVEVVPPTERSEDWRPVTRMAEIAALLSKEGQLSQRAVLMAVKSKRDTAINALKYLIQDGYVSASTPHRLVQPYPPDEGDDE